MTHVLDTLRVRVEQDVVVARRRAREIAAALGFDNGSQVRIATAVSELARNAYAYAGGGTVEARLSESPPTLAFAVSDAGPGIEALDDALAGRYRSRTGLGVGLRGVRRLMDDFQVDTGAGRGTTVSIGKRLPAGVPVPWPRLSEVMSTLASDRVATVEEVRRQNTDLLDALAELEARQEELQRVNRELDETNSGVIALYAELDERARNLGHANELQHRFLSYLSHEFRTPLNSTIALAELLLAEDGDPLTDEQRTQVGFVRQAAEDLTALVDDMLDLARAQAGKLVAHPAPCDLRELLRTLRGTMRPLAAAGGVEIEVEIAAGVGHIVSDEAKLAQILRNLVSNAIKYTPRGSVRVDASTAGDDVVFTVSDTGIGIAADDQERVFEQYERVERDGAPKGTGLGLPLSRRLAELLGGTLGLESEVGVGTTVVLRLPRAPAAESMPPLAVVVVEDEAAWRSRARAELAGTRLVEATSVADGAAALHAPADVVVLDLCLRDEDATDLGRRVAECDASPVIVWTSKPLEAADRATLGWASAILDKHALADGELRRAVLAAAATSERRAHAPA